MHIPSAIKSVGQKLMQNKAVGKAALTIQKHAPEILIVGGIAGIVTSTVLIAKNTLKLEATVDRAKYRLDTAKELREVGRATDTDVVRAYLEGVADVTKLYAGPTVLMVASIGCVVGSHGLMRKRNVALVAAYKAVDQAFTEYRERVIDEFGEEKDRDLRAGVSQVKEVDETTGKTKKVTRVSELDPEKIYDRDFDQTNSNWRGTPEYNLMFLRSVQQNMNDMLKIRGWVSLNDVYDALGYERTRAGMIVGWVNDGGGDGFVDFGLYDFHEYLRRSVTGNHLENAFRLSFNPDGVILDAIEKE